MSKKSKEVEFSKRRSVLARLDNELRKREQERKAYKTEASRKK